MIDIENHPFFKFFSNQEQSLDSVIVCPDGQSFQYGNLSPDDPVVFFIKDLKLLDLFKKNPIQGLKQAYINGYWECNHVLKILHMVHKEPFSPSRNLLSELHLFSNHTKSLFQNSNDYQLFQSLKLEFFSTWLDPSLSHGIAYFNPNKSEPLYIAQQKSIHTILNTLEYYSIHSILDTHAGWGSFSEKACLHHDVTLNTKSRIQAKFCKSRFQSIAIPINYQIRTQPLNPKHHLPYDSAVGLLPPLIKEKDWHHYFHYLSQVLKPGGIAFCQFAFDAKFRPKKLNPILKKYDFFIAEHSHISKNAFKTYKAWRSNLSSQQDQLKQMGFSATFLRQWQYHLSEMAHLFNTDQLSCRQMLLVKQ